MAGQIRSALVCVLNERNEMATVSGPGRLDRRQCRAPRSVEHL